MDKILVTYATMAGSTAEIAQVVGQEIANQGHLVDVLPLDEIKDLQTYRGVVIGAPMIKGWHRAGLRFLHKHRRSFQHIPLAVFVTAMSLTKTGDMNPDDIPVYLDEQLPKPPTRAGSLNFKERYARLPNYLRPILKAAHPVKPVSIGLFGGRLEYGRLKWWAVLFVMLVVQAPAGDRRNWPAIRAWAAGLPAAFQLEPGQAS
jgi:menaquinone-dependent protoporphyrinogen oxidase